MRSRFADTFNHDADAAGYDTDVSNEVDPIRAGYAELLQWSARSAQITRQHDVLELGAGTGNLTQLLLPARRIVAVDVSQAMLSIARTKVAGPIEWQRDDLLEWFDRRDARFDRIVSTYAIHHLLPDEKLTLFKRIRDAAAPRARVVFGDLMFESAQRRTEALKRYRGPWPDVADAIEQEFFWLVDESIEALERLGFDVSTCRFSDLSWGILATLR
jgi:putative AdoMet-dependent methyltransferase